MSEERTAIAQALWDEYREHDDYQRAKERLLHGIADALARAFLNGQREQPTEMWRMLDFLLTRIGSWTNARWDQHLRYEYGDEKAGPVIDAIRRAVAKRDRE